MINHSSLTIQLGINPRYLPKNRASLIFGFFNVLAIIQFSTLQLRPFITSYTNDRVIWNLLTLLISYNVWALLGSLLLQFSDKRNIRTFQYLLFFIFASFTYNLTNAIIYQLSIGHSLELNNLSRSLALNTTGLIHINILFMLSLLAIKNWFDQTQNEETEEKRASIALRSGQTLEYIFLDEIVMIKAEQNYVSIQLEGTNPSKLFRYKISELEQRLCANEGFMRIHRSHIINLNYLTGLSTAENGTDMSCHLNNAYTLPVSRLKKQDLKNIIDTLHA